VLEHKGTMIQEAEIWAVGGGKGGTGKTFVACQLANCLAALGKRVILIDTDFGGANIHTFFGIRNSTKSINQFFEKKQNLEDLIVNTPVKNLSIIPGNSHSVSTSNINYAQKLRLFKQIKRLDADYILLDLGGGTNTDTIDSFILADKLVTVAIPELTAIENLYQFVKSAYFRKIKSVLNSIGLREDAKDTWENRADHGIKTINDLLCYLKTMSPDIESFLTKELSNFTFHIVLNKVRNVRELQEGFSIRSVCIKLIGVNTLFAGYIEYDYQFWRNLSLIQMVPKFIVPHSTKNEVLKITHNIIANDQMKIDSLKYI